MNTYLVEVRTTGRELYAIDADNRGEALKNWHEGELQISEALDAEAISAEVAAL